MRILTHTVTEADSGQTVRQLLGRLWHISGGFLSRLKFRGAITVNGAPVTVRFVPRPGDLLAADVSDLPGENPHIQPVDYPLDILYEDEDLLLINKPAGIAMHPAALTEEPVTIAGAVAHYLRTDCFHAVNRLDRGTTGVMAAAKTGYIHALCMAQLHTDAFQRDYRAVCEGVPVPGEGDIDLPLIPDPFDRPRQVVDWEHGKTAFTHYEVLERNEKTTRVAFYPATGRTHQLRVHAAAPLGLNLPILGDPLYGRPAERLYLHAEQITFFHPITGSPVHFEVLPEF